MPTGTVESIHLIAEHGGPPAPADAVVGEPGRGLRGDRHHGRRDGDDLTLIEAEALERLTEAHGGDLPPGTSRRNVTTRGVDLGTLIGKRMHQSDERAQQQLALQASINRFTREADQRDRELLSPPGDHREPHAVAPPAHHGVRVIGVGGIVATISAATK